ncbi:MAG: zinc-binding dehydrogenase [Gemmatimonadales bacterium]|nr:zinc-binding dehydrogenase [Gemmatimonadales bacterium]
MSLPRTMRAVVKEGAAPGMALHERPVPPMGPDDVLIRVHAAGVCGTDLHIWQWDRWAAGRMHPPVVVGHEFAGAIVAIGRHAAAERPELHEGLLVTAEGHCVDWASPESRRGDAHLCRHTRTIGIDRDGCFADYLAIPATNVQPLGPIPVETGAIMDPLGNAVHTVMEGYEGGGRVLVVGCGPIGCFAVGVARALGSTLVLASDYNPRRRALAERMGAHVALDPGTEDIAARVRALTDGDGVDLVCEMSGHPDGHATAFAAARLGGRVNMLGTPSRSTSVDFARDVIFKGLTLYGVTGRRMWRTWDQMRDLLGVRGFDPMPVVTHRFPLERFADAMAALEDGSAGKVILEIGP